VLLGCIGLIGASLYTATSVETVYDDVSSIQRIAIGADVLTDRTNVDPGQPRNILLVGTTENDGIESGDELLAGRGNTLLADTIMVLRVEPDSGQAYVMSINRDIYVPSIRGKINGAVQYGGIGGLVKVVKEFLGIPIDDFMIVNFSGFRKVVDQLGGVPVYFPYDARDEGSFFDATAGCHVLNGEQALNYVRSRHYEQKINGRWTPDNTNDYGRVERQRDFLVLALDKAITNGARNPTVLKRLLGAATDSGAVTLDTEFTVQQLLDLGQAFANFDPENLQRTALPGSGSMIGEASVILMDDDAAQPILDVFRGNGNTLQPKQVTVELVETRVKPDDTTKVDTLLSGRGFKIKNHVTQSTAGVEPHTILRYSADQRAAALLLSRYLISDPIYQEVTGLNKLTLTLGADYGGVLLLAKTEADMAGKFPGEGTAVATTVPPTTTTLRGGSGGTTPTTTVALAPSFVPAPTTTSGIYGQPPDGVTCK
jgi:LCP family protein required for cell wall assembly